MTPNVPAVVGAETVTHRSWRPGGPRKTCNRTKVTRVQTRPGPTRRRRPTRPGLCTRAARDHDHLFGRDACGMERQGMRGFVALSGPGMLASHSCLVARVLLLVGVVSCLAGVWCLGVSSPRHPVREAPAPQERGRGWLPRPEWRCVIAQGRRVQMLTRGRGVVCAWCDLRTSLS